jgi:hypothetical protein
MKQYLALILNEKLYMVALLVCFADEIKLLKKINYLKKRNTLYLLA